MKILFTGCSGFVGKAVIDEAIKKYSHKSICALSSCPIEGIETVIHNGYEFPESVFIDKGLFDIDTIIHIGAYTPKDQNGANDIKKCNSNIRNTEKLLSVELPNLKSIIFLSAIDVYATANVVSETTPECPISLYGSSKLYCEKMISIFAERKKIRHQILRIGHVFGPGEEKYKKIIPVAILRLLENNIIELFGDGQSIRTFIYINDVVKAILNATELQQSEGVINICGDAQITIECLARTLIEIHGNKNAKIKYLPATVVNRNLVFDNTKLKEKLLNEFTPLVDGLHEEYVFMKEKFENEHFF